MKKVSRPTLKVHVIYSPTSDYEERLKKVMAVLLQLPNCKPETPLRGEVENDH